MTILSMLNDDALDETVRIGILQTTLDHTKAWTDAPIMSIAEARRARDEIQRGVHWLMSGPERPHIVLLPELAVGRTFEPDIARISRESGALVIAGFDYHRTFGTAGENGTVRNQAALFVPSSWPSGRKCSTSEVIWIGKTYPSSAESTNLSKGGWDFVGDPTLWLFDSGRFGRFGVCICYDFLDVSRPVLYRRQIHHLFVLAYNRDTVSFTHNAESLSRTMYCNVVVCNTGHFGGSQAISPYYLPYRRPSFRMDGQKLASAQLVELPVAPIERCWRDNRRPSETDGEGKFKELPPGFRDEFALVRKEVDIARESDDG